MNQVFIAISLRVLYSYPSLNIVEEKYVEKNSLGKRYILIMFYLISFLDSNVFVHEHVSRRTVPESEL